MTGWAHHDRIRVVVMTGFLRFIKQLFSMGDRRDKFETQVYLKPETARLLEKAEKRWRKYDKKHNTGENKYILKNGKTDRDAVIRRCLKEHVGTDTF